MDDIVGEIFEHPRPRGAFDMLAPEALAAKPATRKNPMVGGGRNWPVRGKGGMFAGTNTQGTPRFGDGDICTMENMYVAYSLTTIDYTSTSFERNSSLKTGFIPRI